MNIKLIFTGLALVSLNAFGMDISTIRNEINHTQMISTVQTAPIIDVSKMPVVPTDLIVNKQFYPHCYKYWLQRQDNWIKSQIRKVLNQPDFEFHPSHTNLLNELMEAMAHSNQYSSNLSSEFEIFIKNNSIKLKQMFAQDNLSKATEHKDNKLQDQETKQNTLSQIIQTGDSDKNSVPFTQTTSNTTNRYNQVHAMNKHNHKRNLQQSTKQNTQAEDSNTKIVSSVDPKTEHNMPSQIWNFIGNSSVLLMNIWNRVQSVFHNKSRILRLFSVISKIRTTDA